MRTAILTLCSRLVIAAFWLLAAAPATNAHQTVCGIDLIPNPGLENRTPASESCQFSDLSSWYATNGTPSLRTTDSATCRESGGIVTVPAAGNAWLFLESFQGLDYGVDEAAAIRFSEPMRLGCTYVMEIDTATQKPFIPGRGWLRAALSRYSVGPWTTPFSACGNTASQSDGCPAVSNANSSYYGSWNDDFHGSVITATLPFEYLQLEATRGYHVTIDEIHVHSRDHHHVNFLMSGATCPASPISFDGRLTSSTQGAISGHYWEVCALVDGECVPGAGWWNSGIVPGPPSSRTPPFDFSSCRSYQVKLGVVGLCCDSWDEVIQVIPMGGTQPPPLMEGWWTGDSTTANRLSSLHDASWVAAPAIPYVAGKVGAAFVLDGTSYLEIPNHTDLNLQAASPGTPDGDLSIDTWIEVDPNGAVQPIVHNLAPATDLACNAACCDGDVDGDGDVDSADFAIVTQCFGNCEPLLPACVAADINCNGCVDSADVSILSCQFGTEPPNQACCPEVLNRELGYSFELDDDRLAFRVADATCTDDTFRSVPLPALTNAGWHHVAMTLDRDQTDGGTFYLDGLAVGIEGGGTSFDPSATQGNTSTIGRLSHVRIGADHGATPARLTGQIDELELFPRELSSTEVADVFAADACGKCRDGARCVTPPTSDICLDETTAGVPFLICNDSDSQDSYQVTASGLAAGSLGGTCTVALTDSAVVLSGALFSTNPTTVGGGKCRSYQLVVTRPAALDMVGETACFQIEIENTATLVTTTSTGWIRGRTCDDLAIFTSLLFPPETGPDPDDWGSIAEQSDTPDGTISGWVIQNTGGTPGDVDYTITGTTDGLAPEDTVVGIGGLSPGVPFSGTLSLQPGQQGLIAPPLEFTAFLPATPHTLTLEIEETPGGGLQLVSSAVVVSRIPARACPEASDFDNDGDVDHDDEAILVASLGLAQGDPGFEPDADLDEDGIVTNADQQIWDTCHVIYAGTAPATASPPVGLVLDPNDLDADGFNDAAADNCPVAANPTQADADGDGVGDLCDACPLDAANDADLDGACADLDACPLDPLKQDAGQCGCGNDEYDQDLDGVAWCNDVCPAADDTIDADMNGIADCLEVPVPAVGSWRLLLLGGILALVGAWTVRSRRSALRVGR